jgi:hypothetical protein
VTGLFIFPRFSVPVHNLGTVFPSQVVRLAAVPARVQPADGCTVGLAGPELYPVGPSPLTFDIPIVSADPGIRRNAPGDEVVLGLVIDPHELEPRGFASGAGIHPFPVIAAEPVRAADRARDVGGLRRPSGGGASGSPWRIRQAPLGIALKPRADTQHRLHPCRAPRSLSTVAPAARVCEPKTNAGACPEGWTEGSGCGADAPCSPPPCADPPPRCADVPLDCGAFSEIDLQFACYCADSLCTIGSFDAVKARPMAGPSTEPRASVRMRPRRTSRPRAEHEDVLPLEQDQFLVLEDPPRAGAALARHDTSVRRKWDG